uniref:Uncharacterized protein n=1 Tax=Ananas comosus var. bracteatus TaxID=296719 RepID=A0A6V7QGG0_ANACO|nr:unnamed protein product [Ananas comosus var. bracteatus]
MHCDLRSIHSLDPLNWLSGINPHILSSEKLLLSTGGSEEEVGEVGFRDQRAGEEDEDMARELRVGGDGGGGARRGRAAAPGPRSPAQLPEAADRLPRPKSSDPVDIRSAALEAARRVRALGPELCCSLSGPSRAGSEWEYIGNDELGLDSPKMWAELAEAMLVAPPMWAHGDADVEDWVQGSLWDALL